MSEPTPPHVENFLDRAAFYEGKLAALEQVVALLNTAIDGFGTMPTEDAPAITKLMHQAEAGRAREGHELLLRDRAVTLGG